MYRLYTEVKVSTGFIKPRAEGTRFDKSVETVLRSCARVMACRCYFLSLTFSVCFVVLRLTLTYATYDEEQPHTWDGQLLFSPKSTKAFLLYVWRRNPHLAPFNKKLRPHIPSSYWLLLIAGDVESNPGPTKYPCTSCCKPVKLNQKGTLCDRCDMWTHARCCYVDDDEYQRISALEDSCKWFCPTCTLSELPYAHCRLFVH